MDDVSITDWLRSLPPPRPPTGFVPRSFPTSRSPPPVSLSDTHAHTRTFFSALPISLPLISLSAVCRSVCYPAEPGVEFNDPLVARAHHIFVGHIHIWVVMRGLSPLLGT